MKWRKEPFLSSCQQPFICCWQIFIRRLKYLVNKVLIWNTGNHIPLPSLVKDFLCDPELHIYTLLCLQHWNSASFPQTGVTRLYIYIYMDWESMTEGKRRKKRKKEKRRRIRGSIGCCYGVFTYMQNRSNFLINLFLAYCSVQLYPFYIIQDKGLIRLLLSS